MAMERRNTIQRELVLNAVKCLRSHATAEEVYDQIRREHPSIGKATVYRNLNYLAEEGRIMRVQMPGAPDHFDHICDPHYHVRCEKCGRLFDVDMDLLTGLTDRVKDFHGIRFLGYDILFRGICHDCQKEE